MSLPLAAKRQRVWIGFGVLSGPTNVLAEVWAMLRGESTKTDGYLVNAKLAVELLDEVEPNAAQWWRENTQRLLTGSQSFVFDAAACEMLPSK